MNLYAFQLGRQKSLCLSELKTILGEKNLVEKNNDIVIFELEKADQDLQDRLGGVIKIMKIFKSTTKNKIEKSIESEIRKTLANATGKTPFSINLYGLTQELQIKKILNFCRKIIQSMNIKVVHLNRGNQNPKPAAVHKAKSIRKGLDLNLIRGQKQIHIAKTISTQNVDAYSLRDFKKPCRDAKVGMTPPKLAQTMINLAGKNTKTIYDPFCGTGTFLMEALLMGKTAVGSDLEERMIEYSDKNCYWLTRKFPNASKNYTTFKRDARFIDKELLPQEIDAIVTEGYLGAPQEQVPSPEEQEKIFRELSNLHFNWLSKAAQILKKGCKVVMCVAGFQEEGGKINHLPRFEEIAEENGFKINQVFTYGRSDQVVVRDIKVLERI